ncbi:MAG: hypothetical protein AAFV59_06455 [Pseudomonadota bacterium]
MNDSDRFETAFRLIDDAEFLLADNRSTSAYLLLTAALEEVGKYYLQALSTKPKNNHAAKLEAVGKVAWFMATFESVMDDDGKAVATHSRVDDVNRYTFDDPQQFGELIAEKMQKDPSRWQTILPLLNGIARRRKNAALYQENTEPRPDQTEVEALLSETRYLTEAASLKRFPRSLYAKLIELEGRTKQS